MDNQVSIWILWLIFRHDFSMHTYLILINSEYISVSQIIGWVALKFGTDIHGAKRVKTFTCPVNHLLDGLNQHFVQTFMVPIWWIVNRNDTVTLSLVPLWVWHLWFWGICLYKYWMDCHDIGTNVPLWINCSNSSEVNFLSSANIGSKI